MAAYTKEARNEVRNRLRYFSNVGSADVRDLAYCVEPTDVRGDPLAILADMVATPEQLDPDERRLLRRRCVRLANSMRETADAWRGGNVPFDVVSRWADRVEAMADAE